MTSSKLALLVGAVLMLAPSFVSSADYACRVLVKEIIEQRGEYVRIVPTTKIHQSICRVVARYRHPRKGIDPLEFAQAVQSTTMPLLLTAIARPESSYVKAARNKSGATGLFQVMPSEWGEVPADVTAQALQAEKVLRYYLTLHRGRLRPALVGYLGGESAESVYVDTVLRTFYELKRGAKG